MEFTWDVAPEIFTIPLVSFPIRYYSLLFVLVFAGGFYLLRWQLVRGGAKEEDAQDFVFLGVVAVIVGARLGHVIFYDLDQALRNPLWIFMVWKGGLASHGATIGLLLAMYYYARKKRRSFIECCDRFSFSAALGATLVRLGNFINSEIVGRVTDQSWGVRFPRYDVHATTAPLRHPSQLYEVGLGLFVMGCLYLIDRALGREKRPRGVLIASFFAIYFTGRFLVEFFKEYQTLSSRFPLTMGQCLSIPAATVGYLGLYWAFKKRLPVGWDVAMTSNASAAQGSTRGTARKRNYQPR